MHSLRFPLVLPAVLLLAFAPACAPTPSPAGGAATQAAASASRPMPDIGFRSAGEYDTGGEAFADETVDELLETLDELLARPTTIEDFEGQAGLHLWRFTSRLANGYLTPAQDTRVAAALDTHAEAFPEHAELFGGARFMVEHLMLGKEAPNIVGTDFDGVEFELADYRGKVVALFFTGHWCGPCRSEYPYQRLLLEVISDEDFALLGVNSDDDLEFAKNAKQEENLAYRMWWEGEAGTDGPISTRWNVSGWPTTYVIDEDGVIRYRGKRHEHMITAVKELVAEMKSERAASQ